MRESDIEGWSGKLARKNGWWHRKFKSPGKRSAPDRVFAKFNRRGFYVEFKATDEKATELQREEHKQMREAGLTVYVCDSRALFAAILAYEEICIIDSLQHPTSYIVAVVDA